MRVDPYSNWSDERHTQTREREREKNFLRIFHYSTYILQSGFLLLFLLFCGSFSFVEILCFFIFYYYEFVVGEKFPATRENERRKKKNIIKMQIMSSGGALLSFLRRKTSISTNFFVSMQTLLLYARATNLVGRRDLLRYVCVYGVGRSACKWH